jgi:yeast amino acid transporter
MHGRDVADLPWKSWTYPYAAWFGLIMCILLIIVQFYLAVWPLGGDPDAETFFANYVSYPLFVKLGAV